MSSVVIPLTRGYETVVDEDAAEMVRRFSWHALVSPRKRTVYARAAICRTGGGQVFELLHRFLLQPPSDVKVDHRDGDGLNNRRGNLRMADDQKNAQNRSIRSGQQHPYKGVSLLPSGNWRSVISVGTEHKHLGVFPTIEDAAIAYDVAAVKLFGDFARLNLPEGHHAQ